MQLPALHCPCTNGLLLKKFSELSSTLALVRVLSYIILAENMLVQLISMLVFDC